MKNTKICPKCQSIDIVRIDGYTGAYGSGNNILELTAFLKSSIEHEIQFSNLRHPDFLRMKSETGKAKSILNLLTNLMNGMLQSTALCQLTVCEQRQMVFLRK